MAGAGAKEKVGDVTERPEDDDSRSAEDGAEQEPASSEGAAGDQVPDPDRADPHDAGKPPLNPWGSSGSARRRIGFQPNDAPDDDRGASGSSGSGSAGPFGTDPQDPLAGLLGAMLGGAGGQLPPGFGQNLPPELLNIPGMPTDAASLQQMLSSVQQIMTSGGDGPVNWELATQVARQAAATDGDPSIGEAQHRRVAEALRTAELWLDRVCDLPATTARTQAWSRAEWIENTLPVWKQVVEPVANSVGDAMAAALTQQAPEELQGMLGGAMPMMRKLGGTFFGAQLGQALGALSREVVGGGDIGLPLLPAGRTALVPANMTELGGGLGLPDDEVRLYLALREAAHARLFSGVPWLRAHLLSAVEEYARGIVIDTGRIEAAVRELDPSDAESLQQALSSDLFEPERTPAQQAALDRLETALALVEGWVDVVVDAAARPALPHADALQETIRRRRATGGPAEHTFASLVGLELRPRRLREAAAVWAALTTARGIERRDALWAHPDIVPGEEAFADPAGYAQPDTGRDDMDHELAKLLDGETGKDSGPDAGPDAGPGSS
jgi:putative hydrolase